MVNVKFDSMQLYERYEEHQNKKTTFFARATRLPITNTLISSGYLLPESLYFTSTRGATFHYLYWAITMVQAPSPFTGPPRQLQCNNKNLEIWPPTGQS